MKQLLTIFLLIFFFSISYANTGDEAKIQQTYKKYRSALLSNNGLSAWQEIDKRTQDYYHDIAKDCISLNRKDFDRLDLISKILILRIRLEYRAEQLKKMDGEDIFTVGVNKGWINKSSVQAIEHFSKVIVNQNMAQGFIEQNPNFPTLYFTKEGIYWKISLWKHLEMGNMVLKQDIQNKKMSENEFLSIILGQLSKYKVDNQIFDGPIK
ncbi:MAG: hypothetical protein KJ754_16125 [Bacteroidetes bacterium]|nr:hypothetical protein [Bacteroidota bacterium]MBU1580959.1 hypothetical protein [Bacteroidota bacterium]